MDNLESILSKEAQKTAKEQDPAEVTDADKIEKKEGLLKWSRSATELHNQVIHRCRLVSSWTKRMWCFLRKCFACRKQVLTVQVH